MIDSLVTGTHRELPLNLPNKGQCPDLPEDAVVEAICVVDSDGMRGRDTPAASRPRSPSFSGARSRPRRSPSRLPCQANRTMAEAAFELDPLAGRGDLRATEKMVDELLVGNRRVPACDADGEKLREARVHRSRGHGAPMTRNLLAAGHDVRVASGAGPPIDAAVAAGATDAGTVSGVAAAAPRSSSSACRTRLKSRAS